MQTFTISEDRAAAVAAFYPRLPADRLRAALCQPALPSERYQAWLDTAPAWQLADTAAVAVWRQEGA